MNTSIQQMDTAELAATIAGISLSHMGLRQFEQSLEPLLMELASRCVRLQADRSEIEKRLPDISLTLKILEFELHATRNELAEAKERLGEI